MIPVKFYRDDNYVYYNNPNGITKKMSIADFEAMMSNESELPAHSSSNQGEVLSVDSEGGLEWASLPPAELPAYSSSNEGEVLSVDSNGDLEWASLPSGGGVTYFDATVDYTDQTVACNVTKSDIEGMLNSGSHPVIRFNAPGAGTIYEPLDSMIGSDTEGVFSFQRFLIITGSSSVITIKGYVLIQLSWRQDGGETVAGWSLNYIYIS